MAAVVSLTDARRILGVADDAGADEVNAARRRLAKRSHPDVDGGDTEAMRRLNEAADALLQDLDARDVDVENDTAVAPRDTARRKASHLRVDSDVASFVIEALPAVAFEALLVVTSWIGEVVVDEPPYQLDVLLLDPLRCWCRLDLVPDAGSSTVSITIAALPDEPLPDIDDVRDLWVNSLNHLGR
jgi:hypothetical protein